MKRRYRLRKNSDFQRIRHGGRSEADRFMILTALPNSVNHSRFGFVVSKRIGKAVKRNKIRRRMREATRLRLNQIKSGWDLLFIARVPAREVTYQEIERSIDRLLEKMNLLLAQGERQE